MNRKALTWLRRGVLTALLTIFGFGCGPSLLWFLNRGDEYKDPATGCTFLEIPRVFADKAFRDLKLSRCNNPIVVQFWRKIAEAAEGDAGLESIAPYITSKFDSFLTNDIMRPIVAQVNAFEPAIQTLWLAPPNGKGKASGFGST